MREAAPPFPFVVACGRSGTTLVRAILDSHPDMAVPPETRFIVSMSRRRRRYERGTGFDVEPFVEDLRRHNAFRPLRLTREEALAALDPPPRDFPDAVRRMFASYARRAGKARYGNKTPVHVLSIAGIAAVFPESRFVHVIRDGRDVALSYLDIEGRRMTVEAAALRWRRWVGRGRRAGRRLGAGRYREIRYEDLIADPERVVQGLCEFVDLRYDESMLRYFERVDTLMVGIRERQYHRNLALPPTPGLRDWRRDMDPRDVALFEALAGDRLVELGYERAVERPGVTVRMKASAGAAVADVRRATGEVRRRARRARRRAMLARSPGGA